MVISMRKCIFPNLLALWTLINQINHVCRLHKSIYGLKQAPRAWFARLSSFLIEHAFIGSKTDSSLCIFNHHGIIIYNLIYVDDIIVTGNSPNAITTFFAKTPKTFAIKDLGDLHFFLGIEVIPIPNGLLLSQRRYILDLLTRTKMGDCKPISTPMVSTIKLSRSTGELFEDAALYQSIVGALQYLTITRPDIAFAVNKVCQFMHKPTLTHWIAVKRILRYLKSTINHGLSFGRSSQRSLSA